MNNFQVYEKQDFKCDKCEKEFYGNTFYARENSEITYCSDCHSFLDQAAAKISGASKTQIELEKRIKELKLRKSELLKKKIEVPTRLNDLMLALKEAERFAYHYWEKEKKEVKEEVIKGIKEDEERLWLLDTVIIGAEQSYFKMNEACKSFEKIVVKMERNNSDIRISEGMIDSDLVGLERKLLRIKFRKQKKELLPCKYSNSLGCLTHPEYWCENCKKNYL